MSILPHKSVILTSNSYMCIVLSTEYPLVYSVIQEERSVSWKAIVCVIVRKKLSYARVSNSEWLPR
jgi:hypothetical protein